MNWILTWCRINFNHNTAAISKSCNTERYKLLKRGLLEYNIWAVYLRITGYSNHAKNTHRSQVLYALFDILHLFKGFCFCEVVRNCRIMQRSTQPLYLKPCHFKKRENTFSLLVYWFRATVSVQDHSFDYSPYNGRLYSSRLLVSVSLILLIISF